MDGRTLEALEDEVAQLDAGRAFVERRDVRTTLVSGADVRGWLHDLVTADVASLGQHRTRPSLLLTPTGRIRAAFHVLGFDERGFVLAQADDQPASIDELLSPYVLSSNVELRPFACAVFSATGATPAPSWSTDAWRPSILGEGWDLLIAGTDGGSAHVRRRLVADGLTEASPAAVELRRIRSGRPRFPVDVDERSVPAEAGFESMIDFTKGCFLGQESVAKVRTLGHPARLVIAARTDEPAEVGEEVLADGSPAGLVTSSAPAGGGRALLARVRWGARAADLRTASGVPLRRN